MLPREPDAKFTVRGDSSVVPALLAALREVPRIANAVGNFVTVATADPAGIDAAVRNAAPPALDSFLGTFQRMLQLEEHKPSQNSLTADSLGGFNADAVLRDQYGFVPRLFQAQKEWPELVATEVRLLEAIVFEDAALTRTDKERLLLACAVANGDGYGCALHFGILKLLGEEGTASRIMKRAGAGENPMERLAWASGASRFEQDTARTYKEVLAGGFTEVQRLEALAVCAVGNLLHSLQAALKPAPDFPLPTFPEKDLYLGGSENRPTHDQLVCDDPDAAIVAKVKSGDTDAFADLVRRHMRRVFATLLGILRDAEESRDVSQEAFLKAFENLQRFEGRSKFSSWLMSIAINTGTEVLRKRRNFDSIGSEDDDEEWRPRQIQEWSDNPEECFAKEEMRDLVRRGVMRLPSKYRVALLVRDVSQLSTEDAADALGLSVPALKARVLRGRLMLRETLAPHFVATRARDAHG